MAGLALYGYRTGAVQDTGILRQALVHRSLLQGCKANALHGKRAEQYIRFAGGVPEPGDDPVSAPGLYPD